MRSSMSKPLGIFSALLLAILIVAPVLAVTSAPDAFARTWTRTDKPVADNVIARTWIWGPGPNTELLMEPYLQSPGGMRVVQYFDKSRMEINHPDRPDDGLWYVTNGLLVVELMTGMMQVGDFSFEERAPAEVNIVGDPGYVETPTYADYAKLRGRPALPAGSVITQTVDGNGNIGNANSLASWNITAAELAPITGHRTASVFWTFMNSSSTVYEDGKLVNDRLFINPYYATGYPITEAYWSRVMLAGSEQWVLTQAFERRVLTYAPNNNPGFQVEAGNVGMHYFQWRYEMEPEPATINVTTFQYDGTTVQGRVLVEVYALDARDDCNDVDFRADDPVATGRTNATTGRVDITDLDAGRYCVGADFNADGIANDDTAVVNVQAGASVSVALTNPDDGIVNLLTVTVVGDDDIVVAGATVRLYDGTCAARAGSATPVISSAVTNAAGKVVLNVDQLDAGRYCVIASNVTGIIGQANVELPDDTEVTIGGFVGVTVTTSVGVNEVQTLSASGATSGTFTLTFAGQTTGPIPYNATAAQIRAALVSLSNIGPDDITVTGGPIHTTAVTVTFAGGLGYQNVPQIEADSSLLNDVVLTVTTTTTAVAGVDEVQSLSNTDATGGTFTLTFGAQTTTPLPYNATAAQIQVALVLLTNINFGDVQVTGGPINEQPVTITFVNRLGATDVTQILVNNTGLTGGTVGIVASTTTEGVTQINEVQTIAATGATSGTFTLTFDGQTTGPIAYNASAAQIQIALVALSNIGPDDVVVTGGPMHLTGVAIEFTGAFAGMDAESLVGNASNLFGSTIIVTTTTSGQPPLIQVIRVGSAVSGGTFTLSYAGATTAPIAYNASAAQIELALQALSTIDNVMVTGNLAPGASSTVTFIDPIPTSILVVNDNLIR
jgi:hypothetical protein